MFLSTPQVGERLLFWTTYLGGATENFDSCVTVRGGNLGVSGEEGRSERPEEEGEGAITKSPRSLVRLFLIVSSFNCSEADLLCVYPTADLVVGLIGATGATGAVGAVGAVDTAADAVVVGTADGGGPADAEDSAGFEGNLGCLGFLGVDGREPASTVPGSRPETRIPLSSI